MNWLAGSIRNKILAVFVLGIALVVGGALFGFAAARSGLATVAQVNDTLIAQARSRRSRPRPRRSKAPSRTRWRNG